MRKDRQMRICAMVIFALCAILSMAASVAYPFMHGVGALWFIGCFLWHAYWLLMTFQEPEPVVKKTMAERKQAVRKLKS